MLLRPEPGQIAVGGHGGVDLLPHAVRRLSRSPRLRPVRPVFGSGPGRPAVDRIENAVDPVDHLLAVQRLFDEIGAPAPQEFDHHLLFPKAVTAKTGQSIPIRFISSIRSRPESLGIMM